MSDPLSRFVERLRVAADDYAAATRDDNQVSMRDMGYAHGHLFAVALCHIESLRASPLSAAAPSSTITPSQEDVSGSAATHYDAGGDCQGAQSVPSATDSRCPASPTDEQLDALIADLLDYKHTVPTTRERAEMIDDMRDGAAALTALRTRAEQQLPPAQRWTGRPTAELIAAAEKSGRTYGMSIELECASRLQAYMEQEAEFDAACKAMSRFDHDRPGAVSLSQAIAELGECAEQAERERDGFKGALSGAMDTSIKLDKARSAAEARYASALADGLRRSQRYNEQSEALAAAEARAKALHEENYRLRKACSLLNSMVASGERHTALSTGIVIDAFRQEPSQEPAK